MFIAYPLIWSVLLRDRLRRLLPPGIDMAHGHGNLPAPLVRGDLGHRGPPQPSLCGTTSTTSASMLGMAATILWLYTRYRYTALQTFVVGGLWGVLVEQQFAGPKMLASGAGRVEALTFGSLHLPRLRPVSGGTPAARSSRSSAGRIGPSRWQGLWLFLGITVLPLVCWAIWSAVLQAVGFDRMGVP